MASSKFLSISSSKNSFTPFALAKLSFTSFIFGSLSIFGRNPEYFFGIEPMYPGLLIGLLIYALGFSIKKINTGKLLTE